MNRFSKVILVFLLPLFAMVACAADKPSAVPNVDHRRFVLVSVDGAPFSASKKPDITFAEELRISGQMCNRYMGQGVLDKGVLKVSQMASTKMFCMDAALNKVEDLFFSMLMAGAEIELAGESLILQQGGHVLVFTAVDITQQF